MQKTPEANTDVKGIYYSDHIINIQNIWKILPSNFQLVVKQHPACTGDNNLFFYKKIKNLYNVHLLEIIGVVCSADNKAYELAFSNDSGSSFETSNYKWAFEYMKSNGTFQEKK